MLNNPFLQSPIVSNTNPARKPGPEPLTGKHVTLECLAQNHFSDLYENIGSHFDLWLWWPDGMWSTQEGFEGYLNTMLNLSADLVVYAITPLSGPIKGKAAGIGFALSEKRDTNRTSELGLFLGPQLQRTKAGTEVVYLLGGYMFDLNHRRLAWESNSLNLQSRNAAERYGFVYEGTFRQHQVEGGRNRDTAWYSIIDSEWPLCKKAFEKWLEDENFDEQQRQKSRLQDIRESLKA